MSLDTVLTADDWCLSIGCLSIGGLSIGAAGRLVIEALNWVASVAWKDLG